MADFLTIDAVPWDVQTSGAGTQVVVIGSVSRSFAGPLRSSRRARYVETSGWRTAPLIPADAATFEAYDDGALHSVAGDALGSVSALISIEGSDFIDEGGTAFRVVHRFKVIPT